MVYTAAHEKQKYLPPSVSGNLQCMAAVGIFAFGFPAAEQLLETWGIISLITIRNGLALALLIGLLARAQGLNTLRHLPKASGAGYLDLALLPKDQSAKPEPIHF